MENHTKDYAKSSLNHFQENMSLKLYMLNDKTNFRVKNSVKFNLNFKHYSQNPPRGAQGVGGHFIYFMKHLR
jgi:hypothetical protein